VSEWHGHSCLCVFFGASLIIAITCLIAVGAIVFILGIRPRDLPAPEPVSPFQHLEERKAAIYENLRDLQFEYRLGKLSDQDYQNTKRDLQKELAVILAEVDRLKAGHAAAPAPSPEPAKTAVQNGNSAAESRKCPSCGAQFERDLKFCGECGKPMKAANA
jgi:NADH pyrophosphatase NudC (nudix superfamily)